VLYARCYRLPLNRLFDITTDCGLGIRGSIPRRGKTFFSTSQRPDRLWDPPSLLSNGYWELFPRVQNGPSVNLSVQLHLVLRSRMVKLYLHSPIYIYDIMRYIFRRLQIPTSYFRFIKHNLRFLQFNRFFMLIYKPAPTEFVHIIRDDLHEEFLIPCSGSSVVGIKTWS
jgi:hypothetical protein